MYNEENELHELFDSKRIRGEWFKLDEADIAEIGRRSVLIANGT
jgi:hypothetical protein